MKLIGLFVLSLALAAAQEAFEVASVKRSLNENNRGSSGGPGTSEPGRYYFHSATLEDLIAVAYDVDYFQISSKTSLEGQRFDVDVKIPPGATKQQFRAMMRNLLTERFHLKAHVEKRDFTGYALIVARSGSKLKESSAELPPLPDSTREEFPQLTPGRPGLASRNTVRDGNVLVRMRGHREPVSVFATGLQVPGKQPVVDQTGLTGRYDFTLEYSYPLTNASPDNPALPSALPDLFTALQQQLGLQLVSRKLPFDVVVVESVDKSPIEN
jgi:uncharacterized protein (TIGR03435 family)